MIKVITSRIESNKNNINICIGTHNGIFHCDEVIAIAILALLNKPRGDTFVIRSRNLDFLKQNTDFLVDIGEGEFDHHQKGGNGKRNNNVEYASAGLIWRKFGNYLIAYLSNFKLSSQETTEIANLIDYHIIQNIDLEDNGKSMANHPFKTITSFLPCWNKNDNYNEKFEQCANVACIELENIIETYIANALAPYELISRINNNETHFENILLIPCQTFPWESGVINHNNNSEHKIDFIVFPYPDGGYALQCVPPSLEDKFSQRIPLPETWAGETTNLPNISGITSAIRCHNGRFFARAWDYSDIIKMCQLATKEFLNNHNTTIQR